jgi:hypothetical protein
MAVISNGTTLIDNGILDAAVPTGSLILLSTQTASASATISFTSGIDSTYDSYVFKFIDIHPSTDEKWLTVGFRDGGTDYDATKTTTMFYAYHDESGTDAGLGYLAGNDIAQGTGFQKLGLTGTGNDECASGSMTLYNPSSTTFVKHFIARIQTYYPYAAGSTDYSSDHFTAGYCNVTAAIDGVQFKFDSGNIDSGVIKLYGIGG